jgi:large subunit ribosomal protein L1
MPKRGKKYNQRAAKIDRDTHYDVDTAIALAKQASYAKFDASMDVAINLGVDPRHAEQMVRGAVVLPGGLGKTIRVIVFAEGDKAKEALDAGADEVGSKELVDKIKGGWLDFDKAIATPDMMRYVGPIGRVLGPRGLMPNPKVGTVTVDVGRAVSEAKAGRVEFRVDKAGIVHCPFGRSSFEPEVLKQNLMALLETINRLRPASAKGVYMESVTLSPTIGPGVKLDVGATLELI